jgi:hypothetical protein
MKKKKNWLKSSQKDGEEGQGNLTEKEFHRHKLNTIQNVAGEKMRQNWFTAGEVTL